MKLVLVHTLPWPSIYDMRIRIVELQYAANVDCINFFSFLGDRVIGSLQYLLASLEFLQLLKVRYLISLNKYSHIVQ